jgi:hypothetical protein
VKNGNAKKRVAAFEDNLMGKYIIGESRAQIYHQIFRAKPYLNEFEESQVNGLWIALNDVLTKAEEECAISAADLRCELQKELTKNV